jgi:hypothetical protein
VNGKGPGESLVLHGAHTVDAELVVRAPSWLHVRRVELWAGKRRVYSATIPRQRAGQPLWFRRKLRVELAGERTLHAVALGGDGLELLLGRRDVSPLAFTNPVYLSTHEHKQPAGQGHGRQVSLPQ